MRILSLAVAASCVAAAAEAAAAVSPYGPSTPWLSRFIGAAPASQVVRAGAHARFTLLAEALVRLEWSADGAFDDAQTVNIVHRAPEPAPAFSRTGGGGDGEPLVLSTRLLELRYDAAAAAAAAAAGAIGFVPAALSVRLKSFPFSTWRPGAAAAGNLHGTVRTLDRVGEALDLACLVPRDYMTYYAHCEEGLASRDGWVVVDDSLRPRFEAPGSTSARKPDAEWDWPGAAPAANVAAALEGRVGPYQDLYFFGHGRNYSGALADYVRVAGAIPLLPRYALGPGFSRWYAWNQAEEQALVQEGFNAHGLPLDGLSVDMDWHLTYPHGLPNPHGVTVEGWTGYTTDPSMFPDFAAFFAHMKRRGVFVNLNMHPAAGVEFHEAAYPAAAASLGMDPAKGQTIAFEIESQAYAAALFEHVLKPLDDMGLDYWRALDARTRARARALARWREGPRARSPPPRPRAPSLSAGGSTSSMGPLRKFLRLTRACRVADRFRAACRAVFAPQPQSHLTARGRPRPRSLPPSQHLLLQLRLVAQPVALRRARQPQPRRRGRSGRRGRARPRPALHHGPLGRPRRPPLPGRLRGRHGRALEGAALRDVLLADVGQRGLHGECDLPNTTARAPDLDLSRARS
jgi:hypothetical protein